MCQVHRRRLFGEGAVSVTRLARRNRVGVNCARRQFRRGQTHVPGRRNRRAADFRDGRVPHLVAYHRELRGEPGGDGDANGHGPDDGRGLGN